MHPVKFKGNNTVIGESQEEYNSLPARIEPSGEVQTVWELSEEDLELIKTTKRIRLTTHTFNQPLQPIQMEVLPQHELY